MSHEPSAADAPHNCPHCNISLLGKPIPDKYLKHYGGAKYYKLEIGVEVPEYYDGVYYYKCPDCGGTWGGHRALEIINESV